MQPIDYILGNTQRTVYDLLSKMPGLTVEEIASLMPAHSRAASASAISAIKRKGFIRVTDKKYNKAGPSGPGSHKKIEVYEVNPEWTPERRKPMKLQKPTDTGYAAQIDALKTEINDLKLWKKDAIERFPDLAVEPVVLRARKLVVEELLSAGDAHLADQVRKGLKDGTLMVRIAIKALEVGD